MLDDKPTTGSIETTAATKRKFAGESLEYNVKQDKLFCSLFPEYVELWEKREEQRKAKLAELGLEDTKEDAKKGVLTNTGEVNDIYAFGAGIVAVLSILFAILRFL
jgi:ubiquitin-conjugating enzyme E2 J2